MYTRYKKGARILESPLFVTATSQSPGLPETLATAYNPGMRLLGLPVIENKPVCRLIGFPAAGMTGSRQGHALYGGQKMKQMDLKALAKINLGLDVLGKREDGYHIVRMVMQTIYLYDEVRLVKREEPGVSLVSNLPYLPSGEGNIAYKAAKLLQDEFGIREGVDISLRKHIPVAAGLAGGSANAAAVLFGMNRMFDLGLSQKGLMERGVKLGADVPYCIMRGTVLAEGIGEKLQALAPMPKCTVLIAKPPVSVSTRTVYEALDGKDVKEHPDIDGILSGLEKGDLKSVASAMGNVLEQVTIPMHPVIREIKKEMKASGALNAMMSGSGPTVFGLFENRADAKNAQRRIRDKALTKQVYVTSIHTVRRNKDGN